MTLERCNELLGKALAHNQGTHTLADIYEAVRDKSLILGVGNDAVVVLEIVQYPQARWLNIFLAGGAIRDLAAMMPRIEATAREHGCTKVMGYGRAPRKAPAWGRLQSLIGHFGFHPAWTCYVKELTE